MAALTAKQRSKMSASTFAGPDRSYPVNDREHAGLAKSFAKRALKKGRLTRAQYDRIVAKANRKLGEK